MTANMTDALQFAGPFAMLSGCNLWLAVDQGASQAEALHPSNLSPDAQLSDDDLRRWERFRTVEKQRQFLLSRIAVAEVLRRECRDGSTARFITAPSGRPMVLSHNNDEVRQISLSHSGPVTAIAISSQAWPVGVDVEIVEPIHADALRSVVERPDDRDFMNSLQDADEAERLRTLWTIKESVWKSLSGRGPISAMDVTVQIQDGEPRPSVRSNSQSLVRLKVQLFTIDCSPVTQNTQRLKLDSSATIGIRGCLTQVEP